MDAIEWEPGTSLSLRYLPLSSVRYDTVEVDATDVADFEALDRLVAESTLGHLEAVVDSGCGPLRVLSCRIRVIGRTSLHGGLEERLRAAVQDLRPAHRGVEAHVERILVETRPAVDLEELAGGSGAPGMLARLILGLDGGTLDTAQTRLLQDLGVRVGQVGRARPYLRLDREEPSAEEIRSLARAQAFLLLDTLLAQKEVA